MYQLQFPWNDPTDLYPVLNRIYKESHNYFQHVHPNEIHFLDNLMFELENYIFLGCQIGLFTAEHWNHTLNRLNQIKRLSVLEPKLRYAYGINIQGSILINPGLPGNQFLTSEQRTRLYIFHELSHIFLEVNTDQKANNAYEAAGWGLFADGLCQEVAESLTYYSIGINRPNYHLQNAPDLFGDGFSYYSNCDHYGYTQPLLAALGSAVSKSPYTGTNCYSQTLWPMAVEAAKPNFMDEFKQQAYNSSLTVIGLKKILRRMGTIINHDYTNVGHSLIYPHDSPITDTRYTAQCFNEIIDLVMIMVPANQNRNTR